MAAQFVAYELILDRYGLEKMPLSAGDVVIDVGGHIGLFAIYVGRHFPDVVIHSFEPFPDNCRLFNKNIELNHITNVRLHCLGVTGNGRDIEMVTDPLNSAAATCNSKTLYERRVGFIPSTTLERIFRDVHIPFCRLLKIDCEGSEYEILLSTPHVLRKVEYLSAEFHMNKLLASRGFSVRGLIQFCEHYIDPGKFTVNVAGMSE